MKIAYKDKKFKAPSLEKIEIANQIIEEYREQGYDLTVRQLYYQMVSRDIIPNNQREYNKLGRLISEARMAGLIDWTQIVDRTRTSKANSHWREEAEILRSAAHSFRLDKWANQTYKPRVWIEKDALTGVIQGVCSQLDVPYMSCRGYLSQSALWQQSQIIERQIDNGFQPVIVHLGDHDPSGIDMTRDIEDRLILFEAQGVTVHRIALNFDQVEQYNPPPNFAKETDSRYETYVDTHGTDCWELDALEPSVISTLIEDTVLALRDENKWKEALRKEQEARKNLLKISEGFDGIIQHLRDQDGSQ